MGFVVPKQLSECKFTWGKPLKINGQKLDLERTKSGIPREPHISFSFIFGATLSKFCRLGHSENGETPKEGLYMKKKSVPTRGFFPEERQ